MAEPAKVYAVADGPFKELTEQAVARLSGCERQKNEFDLDIRESYFFSQPHRAREIRSAQAISVSKPTDADTLQTGIAMELVDDFNTEVINSFMPQAEPWAERRPGMFIPPALRQQAKDAAAKQDPLIFDAIRASNLYEEFPKLGADVAIGTAAFSIDDLRPAENIVVQAIPLHEIEINVGPFGGIDDRFIVRHTKNRHVKALLGATYEKLDAECRREIEDAKKQDQVTIIRWGWWRLWDRLGDVVWQHVVMKDMKVVHAVELTGEGSCPMVVFRFNPSPEWAYGWGPLPKSLPDLRQIDDIQAKKIEHIDLTLAPPSTYPDDSGTAFDQGVEAGKMYPVRPGSEGAVKQLIEPGSMEPAIYEVDAIERALRHRFYVGMPEQRGKTPPTATQWLDEMQLAQRRFGTPGASFWKEGPAAIFLRFKFLLEKRGVIAPIEVNGKIVSLEPYNPAQRAAEQQEVAMAARYLSIVGPTWPEEFRLRVDGSATMQAIADKMRVGGLIKFRTDQEAGNIIEGIKALSEGRQQIRPSDPAAAGTL